MKKQILRQQPQAPSTAIEQFEAPSYAFTADATSQLDALRGYTVLPRLVAVQPLSDKSLLNDFDVGDLVVSPLNVLVPNLTNCVVLFFFPSWAILNDIGLKGLEPALLDYTLDPKSDIAKKSQFAATREEPHPNKPKMVIRYISMLNFVIVLPSLDECRNQPILLTYRKAEYRVGMALASKLSGLRMAFFARRWELNAVQRKNNKGDWYSVQLQSPTDGASPYLNEEEFKRMEVLYKDIKATHEKNAINSSTGLDTDDHDGSIVDEAPDTTY